MSVGGAVAGGARLAVASDFEPATFWDEVRRYGATIVSYTWAMIERDRRGAAEPGRAASSGPALHGLGDAARACGGGSASASLRRGCSSSTPRPRATRCSSTSPATSRGARAGRCRAAPRSGSPPTTRSRAASSRGPRRLRDRLRQARAGNAARPASGPTRSPPATAILRGVFEPGDAWLETGDLFRRDVDGDFWLVDHVPSLIRTAAGRRPVGADPGCARRRRRGRARGRLRGSDARTARARSPARRSPCARGASSTSTSSSARSPTSATAASPGSSASSTRSR